MPRKARGQVGVHKENAMLFAVMESNNSLDPVVMEKEQETV